MKSLPKTIVLVLIIALILVTPVLALQEESPAGGDLSAAWLAFIALVGWPAFQVAALNLLVLLGVVKQETVPVLTFWSSALAFVAVAFLVFTGRVDILSGLDATLGQLAAVLIQVLILLGGGAASLAVNQFIQEKTERYPVFNGSRSFR